MHIFAIYDRGFCLRHLPYKNKPPGRVTSYLQHCDNIYWYLKVLYTEYTGLLTNPDVTLGGCLVPTA